MQDSAFPYFCFVPIQGTVGIYCLIRTHVNTLKLIDTQFNRIHINLTECICNLFIPLDDFHGVNSHYRGLCSDGGGSNVSEMKAMGIESWELIQLVLVVK